MLRCLLANAIGVGRCLPRRSGAKAGAFDVFLRSGALAARPSVVPYHLRAVAADGFNWTSFHRLLAEPFFFRGFWLLVNIGMAAVVVTFEIGWRGLTAQIAVDALIIDVEFARYVFGVLICHVGHGLSL